MAERIHDEPGLTCDVRDDGGLHIVAEGELDKGMIERIGPVILAWVTAHPGSRSLLEVRDMNLDDLAARWALAGLMRETKPYTLRTAVLGLSPTIKIVGQIVVRVAGRKNVRFFSDRDAAEAYLRDG